MAMAKIASHLNHLVHREPVLSRQCAREHWIFPSPSALMRSRESRCRSVAAVAWRASESREFMLHQPIVHRMRFQRLGDRGRKNRRPFVAEMARDAAIGDANLGYPDLFDARAEVARVFDFAVVAKQLRKLLLIRSPIGAELKPEADHDKREEQDRHRDQPAEVLRLERFVLVALFFHFSHFNKNAASRGAAGRASRSASRDRAGKPRP